MNIGIVQTPLSLTIYGFSAAALHKDYAGTAFGLMDRMWKIVKAGNLANKGRNIWVYEPRDMVFAGVELEQPPPPNTGLEEKNIVLSRHAYYKHIGPYNQIKQSGLAMQDAIKSRGFTSGLPYIEIYGHWTSDETKLETDLLVALI